MRGKAAPEIVNHGERLLHPMARTTPKGSGDPGWRRVTWDEALDTVAARFSALADEHGPESVVFSCAVAVAVAVGDVGLRGLGDAPAPRVRQPEHVRLHGTVPRSAKGASRAVPTVASIAPSVAGSPSVVVLSVAGVVA